MKHPIKTGTLISYDSRRFGCRRPLRTKQNRILKQTEINGVYYYGLENGRLIPEEKVLKIE